MWWGSQAPGFVEGDANTLLESFEVAWAAEIEEWGHQAPYGMDRFLFNVVLADSGEQSPSSYGAGAYYYLDPAGYPVIVFSEDSTFDPDWQASTAAHEFYHAIQDAAARYPYEGVSAWYWEASAEWAAGEVYPENPYGGSFIASRAFLRYLPISAFDYFDTGSLAEYVQYGSFISLQHLTEVVDVTLVPRSWTDTTGVGDPWAVLSALIAADGGDLAQMWLDQQARDVTWDYPQHDLYASTVAQWAAYYPDQAADQIAAVHADQGVAPGEHVPKALYPQHFGANIIELRSAGGDLIVDVGGDEFGSEGSAAGWGARVVRRVCDETSSSSSTDCFVVTELVPFEGNIGHLDMPYSEAAGYDAWLVVGAFSLEPTADRWETETFEYTYGLASTGIVETVPTTEEGVFQALDHARIVCGCESSRGAFSTGFGGFWVAAFGVMRRHRE